MVTVHPREAAVGIDQYVSETPGIGGTIRGRPGDFRVREREQFPTEPADADPGDYPYLIVRVTLRNWDTNDFVGALADQLEISRGRIDWAGTKDKRAVTTQLFSIKGIGPTALPALSDVEYEVVGRAGRALEFGDLAGNEFKVVVRNATAPDRIEQITAELRAFGDGTVGVPNYFGQQRFGSRRPITHEVGLAIIDEDWEEAVRIYTVQDADTESADTRQARQEAADRFADTDWKGALSALPTRLDYERTLLHALIEGKSFREAIETLPRQLQRLFVHAAQSYLFNRMLSERLAAGLPFAEPVVGDVVCFADRDAPSELTVPDPDRTQRVTEARLDTIKRHCARGRAFVTAPLVGTDTTLSDGQPGEIERTVLTAEGIEPASFALPGEWASTGTRRAILVRTDLSVEHSPPTFSFALPKGSYATVLLREYLKVSPTKLG